MVRGYTTIKQSRKLAEILPIESADMFYIAGKGEPIFIGNKTVAYGDDDYDCLGGPDILCWSLVALIDVLPRYIDLNTYDTFLYIYPTQKFKGIVEYSNSNDGIDFSFGDKNLIDACYEMILKLHELNLL